MILAVPSATRDSFGDQVWFWIERASWLAAVFGVLGLIVVIAQIAQLIRRPKLKLGFPYDPGGKVAHKAKVRGQETITPTWGPGSQLSDPIEISVSVINEGNATARSVLFEVRYPHWLMPVGVHQLKMLPVANLWSRTVPSPVLNPGVGHFIKATFRVPKSHQTFKLYAIASMQDSRKAVERTLTVKVN